MFKESMIEEILDKEVIPSGYGYTSLAETILDVSRGRNGAVSEKTFLENVMKVTTAKSGELK
jgi:hypothetical protein